MYIIDCNTDDKRKGFSYSYTHSSCTKNTKFIEGTQI